MWSTLIATLLTALIALAAEPSISMPGLLSTAAAAEVSFNPSAGGSERGVTISIYADGTALVEDRRAGELPAGLSQLALPGVSPRIQPSSVLLTGPKGLSIGEIRYDFNVLTPQALLRRSVGKPVEIVRTNPASGADIVETATIVSAEDGVVLRYADRIEIDAPERLRFRELPAGLHPFPTLTAAITAEAAGRRQVDLRYLTDGLSWQADYVVLVDAGFDRLDLKGRATLSNLSGADFADASVGLIAGRLNRVGSEQPMSRRADSRAAAAPMMAEMAAPEALGDLYLYRLAQPLSIADKEVRQLPLLGADGIAVRRDYISETTPAVFNPRGPGSRPDHPRIVLRFDNVAKAIAPAPGSAAPSVPLPAGIARVYGRDAQGTLRLIGEDRLPDTPVGGTVEVSPGEAFDLTVERKQTDFVRAGLPENSFESAWAIEARNASDRPATVTIIERLPGDWRILNESAVSEKKAADRAEWRLPVAAKGAATLTYRVRVQR